MGLEFKGDAICLSGLTGSKLKCEVIARYYPLWWGITSGGPRVNHRWPTAIAELDAATGEVFIEDTGETVPGSSGHALALKLGRPDTGRLKVVLVEKDPACYGHLKNVINRRWKSLDISVAEGPIASNRTGVYLIDKPLGDALEDIGHIDLGNALFFFDPLRGTEYAAIDQVARARMASYFKTRTEVIVFLLHLGLVSGQGRIQWAAFDAGRKSVVCGREECRPRGRCASREPRMAWPDS